MRAAAAALVAAALLAGCSDGKDPGPVDPGAPREGLPMLHGWVVDPAVRPLAGVRLAILETGANTTSDADGFWGFPDVPRGRPLVVVAELEGFVSASSGTTLPPDGLVRLNLTLAPVPVAVPYSEVLPFEGRIACELGYVAANQSSTIPCDQAGESLQVFDIAVAPNLAGAVIEVVWEPTTQAADSLGAVLETLGMGDQNQLLGQAVGESILRIDVARLHAERYYASGGHMRLTVHVEPNVDEEEASSGAGFAVEQEFHVYASLFYHEGPAGDYTIADIQG